MKGTMTVPDRGPILLVGASGRVGRMVMTHWSDFSDRAMLLPQYRSACPKGGLIWDPLDGPEPLLDAAYQIGGFGTLVVLAGVTPGQGKVLGMNRVIAEACMRAAKKAEISRVLLASSSAVYGLGDGRPFSEDMPCDPANDYGRAKLEMEQACVAWRDAGVDVCCLRIGNVAGADALLLNIAKSKMSDAVTIDLFEDGRGPLRSYIGPRTMAAALQSLCDHPDLLPEVLNFALPAPVHMEALARAAKHPWRKRYSPKTPYQNITLNCTALSLLHHFAACDALPETMIEQWKACINL
jgi:UDP-glucose 4-epimerase